MLDRGKAVEQFSYNLGQRDTNPAIADRSDHPLWPLLAPLRFKNEDSLKPFLP